jgi:hypothetical protein
LLGGSIVIGKERVMEETKKQELTNEKKWWFLQYLKVECEVVLSAWKELTELKKYASENKLDEQDQRECSSRMWRCISEILLAIANISKTIYGSGKLKKDIFKIKLDLWAPGKSEEEKEKLYEKLYGEIEIRVRTLKKMFSSILDKQGIDRSARDYIEHFDAFLQLYIIEKGAEVKTHRSFGCPDQKELLEKNLSFFHCRTDEIWLFGKPFPMGPVIEFIRKLEETVESEIGKLR